jgi:hypothetical protein
MHRVILLKTQLITVNSCLLYTGKKNFRVLQNRVLGRILELKSQKGTEVWRTLHIEEFRILYDSQNFIRIIQ